MDEHEQHDHVDHSMPEVHQGHDMSSMSTKNHSQHAGHGTDHTGHEQMFRVRFWWSLLLSIPVLLYSGMIQMWLGFTPVLAT
jgi:P-type Cu2+ transporter